MKMLRYLLTVLVVSMVLFFWKGDLIAAPRLVDDAGLLSSEEKDELLDKLDEIRDKEDFDVVIVTKESLDGKSPQDYADDYFDYNGYGVGKDKDGILLVLGMEERKFHTSTSGFGRTAFTDAGLTYMEKQYVPDLSDGNYYEAFDTFADLSADFVRQAKTGTPYDEDNLPKKPMSPFLIIGDFLAAFAASFFAASHAKSKLKSVRHKTRAGVYLVKDSLALNDQSEVFLGEHTESRRIERDTDSDDHGGSHMSSSGSMHGGHGGSF